MTFKVGKTYLDIYEYSINMMDVELKIKIPNSWVEEISRKFPAPIKFIKCLPHGKEGGRGLIEIESKSNIEIENMFKEIEKHPNVCRVDFSKQRNGGFLGSITTKMCVICNALTGSDCFLESAVSDKLGFVNWKIITISNNSLQDILKKLEDSGCEVEIRKITKLSKKSLLTKRQEQILKVAFEKGYYEFPKKITIKELAIIFGVAQSTLQEILQRGERKVIFQHFNKIS